MYDEEEGIDGYDYDEKQSKRKISRVFGILMYSISFLFFAVLIIRFFTSCNSEYSEMILLDDSAATVLAEQGNLAVSRIHTEVDKEDDARIRVGYVTYLSAASNFQLTLQMKSRYYPIPEGAAGYRYVLRRLSGDETTFYTDFYYQSEHKTGYDYIRVCFTGVSFEENDSLTLLIFPEEYVPTGEGEAAYPSSAALRTFRVYSSDFYSQSITPEESDYIYIVE